MSENPHPDAGKPEAFLSVGTVYVCIPCTVRSRHEWSERAWRAENRILDLYKELKNIIAGLEQPPKMHTTT